MLVWGGCSISQPLWNSSAFLTRWSSLFGRNESVSAQRLAQEWYSSFICHSEEFKCPSTDGRIRKLTCACTVAERTSWTHRFAWRVCRIMRGWMRRSHDGTVACIWNSGKCAVVYRDRKGVLPCVAGVGKVERVTEEQEETLTVTGLFVTPTVAIASCRFTDANISQQHTVSTWSLLLLVFSR